MLNDISGPFIKTTQVNIPTTGKYAETKLRIWNVIYDRVKQYFLSLLKDKAASTASYKIKEILAKKNKPFEDSNVIKKCAIHH